jgi:hypothetical protein
MEPAQTIIRKFGGPTALSALLGIHRTRISSWQRAKSAGGTDGLIPQSHHPALLAYARDNAIDLKAEDFLPIVPLPSLADGGEPADAESEAAAP